MLRTEALFTIPAESQEIEPTVKARWIQRVTELNQLVDKKLLPENVYLLRVYYSALLGNIEAQEIAHETDLEVAVSESILAAVAATKMEKNGLGEVEGELSESAQEAARRAFCNYLNRQPSEAELAVITEFALEELYSFTASQMQHFAQRKQAEGVINFTQARVEKGRVSF